ncbi:MAG: 1-phosphofructokinase [Atopobiaceae bacterium]|jgi:1-phosphofructokinase/6-phosphofructokinase 2
MIYTLTTNPAIDMNVFSERLAPNCVTRTRDAVYTPNGKGLNVSFTLKHFGIDSVILGFFGGFTGEYIVEGAERVCPVRPVWIDGITRVNVFITTNKEEYILPNAGARVAAAAQKEMLEVIDGCDDLSCLVISGSLPPGIDPSYYNEVIDIVQAKGAEFILDISHPCLAELVRRKPLLIKPNEAEIQKIFGIHIQDEADVLGALRSVHGLGAQNILLTLGSKGAYFFGGGHVWHANAAKVKVLSTACAGDASLAGFISVWEKDCSAVKDALVNAMATGGSVAMSAGLGDFSAVRQLRKQIEVIQMK